MMRPLLIGTAVLLTVVASSGLIRAQPDNPIKGMELPKRTEQHRILDSLVGDWSIKGRTFRGCPYGEGTFTAREHNELMRGGLFLVSRTQYSSLFKNSNQIAFFGVDPGTKEFTYALYSNLGVTVQATGQLRDANKRTLIDNGIEWTQKSINAEMHGQQTAVKYTTDMVSPDEYRFKLEAGGIAWYEGVARKVTTTNPNPVR